MASRTLEITFIGNPKPVQDAFEQVGSAGGTLQGKMSGLQSALGGVGTVAAGMLVGGGVAKLGGFLVDAGKAAAEDAAATARLEQVLRNASGSFDENLAKVNARIAAGQKLAFSDDDIRDSFQKLLAATGDTDEALRRQALAMDLARGAGIPLSQASTLLGKVTAENVEVFKRMGITIGEGASEAEAFAAIQAKFGGQADAYAKSTAGQFEQAKIRMSELKEQLGAAVLPAFAALAAFLTGSVLPAMEKLGTWVSEHTGLLKTLAAAIAGPLVAAFAAWAVSAAAAAAATIAAAAPVIAVGVAIAALSAGIYLLISHWDDLEKKYPPLKTATETMKDALSKVGDVITGDVIPALRDLADGFNRNVMPALRAIGDFIITYVVPAVLKLIGVWIDVHVKVVETIIPPLVAAIQLIADKAEDVAGWVGHWLNVLGEAFWDVVNMVREPVNTILGWFQSIIDKAGAVAGAIGKVTGAAGAIGGAVGGFASGVFGQSAGGAAPLSAPGGAGNPSVNYQDPRGVTLTADDIYNMRQSADFGFVGAKPSVVINIQNANMTDQASANRTLTNALRAAGAA